MKITTSREGWQWKARSAWVLPLQGARGCVDGLGTDSPTRRGTPNTYYPIALTANPNANPPRIISGDGMRVNVNSRNVTIVTAKFITVFSNG